MKLYPNELATVLAALRYWQRHALREAFRLENGVADLAEGNIATDGGELRVMTREEIDSLCERINTDSEGEPRLNVPITSARADEYAPFPLPWTLLESPSRDGVLDGNGVLILNIPRHAPTNPDRTALEYMVTAVNERG